MSNNGKTATLRRPDKMEQSCETDTTKLARLISAYAPHDGVFELGIPGLHASRSSRIKASVCMPCGYLACPSLRKERRRSSWDRRCTSMTLRACSFTPLRFPLPPRLRKPAIPNLT